jgi:nicotinamidase-related amidase
MPLTTLDPNTCRKASSTGVSSSHRRGHRRNARLDRCFPCEEPSARAGQCGGTGAGPDGQGPRSSISFSEGWTDLLPQLDQQPSDIVVTKRSWGAFAATDLERQLRREALPRLL